MLCGVIDFGGIKIEVWLFDVVMVLVDLCCVLMLCMDFVVFMVVLVD